MDPSSKAHMRLFLWRHATPVNSIPSGGSATSTSSSLVSMVCGVVTRQLFWTMRKLSLRSDWLASANADSSGFHPGLFSRTLMPCHCLSDVTLGSEEVMAFWVAVPFFFLAID